MILIIVEKDRTRFSRWKMSASVLRGTSLNYSVCVLSRVWLSATPWTVAPGCLTNVCERPPPCVAGWWDNSTVHRGTAYLLLGSLNVDIFREKSIVLFFGIPVTLWKHSCAVKDCKVSVTGCIVSLFMFRATVLGDGLVKQKLSQGSRHIAWLHFWALPPTDSVTLGKSFTFS